MAASHTVETLKAADGKTHTLHSTAHSDFTTRKKTLSSACCLSLMSLLLALFAVVNQSIRSTTAVNTVHTIYFGGTQTTHENSVIGE